MKDTGDHHVEIPPQPDPAVSETAFAEDTRSGPNLTGRQIRSDNGYGSASRPNNANGNNSNYGSSPITSNPTKSAARSLAPDALRGLLMVLMALDHNVQLLRPWPHATAVDGEADSVLVSRWNRPLAYVMRTLTHLCAPGFTFLLGMGVVYFGRSRTNLGWGTGKMSRHFLIRSAVLLVVMEVLGLAITAGNVWLFNIVLFALAVDYLLVGWLWQIISKTEFTLAYLLLKVLPEKKEDDPTEPLLQDREGEENIAPDRAIIRASDISWHLHNVFLLGLALVTIGWNVWLSPTNGYCGIEPVEKLPSSTWVRILFYSVMSERVFSTFPPMAWLSFAILGLLYGRIILARSWNAKAIATGNILAGVVFTLIFVATRLLHFGNLSEDCLQMPEHLAHTDQNQYLASATSFFYLIKYPPDVAFWSFTMACNFFLLAFFGSIPPRIASRAFDVLLVYGTSALFFYVVHLFLLDGTSNLLIYLIGHPTGFYDPLTGTDAVGVDQLWAFFLNWVVVLAVLYPLCRYYGEFKKTRGPDSIWKFF